MKIIKYLLILLSTVYQTAHAVESNAPDENESLTLIVYESQSQSKSNDGSSGNSRSRSAILEHRLGFRDGGLELEYSFPQSDIPESEAWILPARVLVVPGNPIKLLNEPEITDRLHSYLKKNPEIAKLCGEVIFTWTAFEIHCSTNHVIDVVKGFNLYFGKHLEGIPYEEPGVLAPAPLKLMKSNKKYLVFQANFTLDPKILQSDYEQSMKQAAKITGSSYDSMINSALKLAGDDKPVFSGSRIVTLVATPTGYILKLQRETITTTKGGRDFQESRTVRETLERQSIK